MARGGGGARIATANFMAVTFRMANLVAGSIRIRRFSNFHHNIMPSDDGRIPPASEKTGYLNLFDHAEHPSLWEDDQRLSSRHPPVERLADLVEPSNHPHHYEGFLVRERYAHYCQTAEGLIPKTPDLSKGELASGATVVRTNVWQQNEQHNFSANHQSAVSNEPAIVTIGRFCPDNFRAAGYAENVPNPDSINSHAHPDFRHYRLPNSHADRRPFMYMLSAAYFFVAASMARSAICKMIHFWWIPRDVMASGTTEVDLSSVKAGQQVVVKWRGKPVFVKHRTQEEIEMARKDDALIGTMKDPQLDSERAQRPEWLVNVGVCTHLGCIPTEGGSYNGWFCPCHGSHYDISGRIRQGPAPANLEIPPYEFISDNIIKLG